MDKKTTTTARFESKSGHILDKGMEVMWGKGYNGTSVNDIVKAADVPKGSFYFYFDSKEDFAVKALNRYFNMMFEPARAIIEDNDLTAVQKLDNIYQMRVNIAAEKMHYKLGCFASNMGSEMSDHSESIRDTIVQFESLVRARMKELVEQAQIEGGIKDDVSPENIVAFIEDAFKGALVTMKEVENSESLDNLMFILKKCFFK